MLPRLTLTQKNIVANFLGQASVVLLGMIFVPWYLSFLGMEAYGLVGLFAFLQTALAPLDLGLGVTVNREMAILSSHPEQARSIRSLTVRLQIIYWLLAFVAGGGIALIAPLLASHWLKPVELTDQSIRQCIMLMGLAVAFHFPIAFYTGGLMGLQRQVSFNVLQFGVAVVRNVGAYIVLWKISTAPEDYFLWQALVSLIHTSLLAWLFWSAVPRSGQSEDPAVVNWGRVKGFATGMSGLALISLALTHTDKFLLSTLLSLKDYGYYNLASLVAAGVGALASPLFITLFPRFSQMVATRDDGLASVYHHGCQLMSVLILPLGIWVAFFSFEILSVWTRDTDTTQATYEILRLLVIGTALNSLCQIPGALQLAHGWTSLAIRINLVALLFQIPLLFVLARTFGGVGAASVWVLLNATYLFVGVPLMHQRILPKEMWPWYLQDIGKPLTAAVGVAAVARMVVSFDGSNVNTGLKVALIGIAMFIVSLVSTPLIRRYALQTAGERFFGIDERNNP